MGCGNDCVNRIKELWEIQTRNAIYPKLGRSEWVNVINHNSIYMVIAQFLTPGKTYPYRINYVHFQNSFIQIKFLIPQDETIENWKTCFSKN